MKTRRNGGFTIIVLTEPQLHALRRGLARRLLVAGLWRGLLVFIVWIATAGGCALSAPMTQNEKMK